MINLLTGTPGSGKSTFMISFLIKEIKEGRPLFVHGIPDLKLHHTPIICESNQCNTCKKLIGDTKDYLHSENMQNELPEDSIVILDEAQHIYRPRRPGAVVPENVQFLETHRHLGIDIWLITQSPKLIDINCRELVSRHIHVIKGLTGRKMYEWSLCKTQVQDELHNAVESKHKIDPKVFEMFTSATAHYKQKRKLPSVVYWGLPVFILLLLFTQRFVSRFTEKYVEPEALATAQQTLEQSEGQELTSQLSFTQQNSDGFISADDLLPREPFRLETAPIYDSLVEIKDFPRISACLATKDRCSCYTQQGTFYPTTFLQCLDFIDGRTFNPYLATDQ